MNVSRRFFILFFPRLCRKISTKTSEVQIVTEKEVEETEAIPERCESPKKRKRGRPLKKVRIFRMHIVGK